MSLLLLSRKNIGETVGIKFKINDTAFPLTFLCPFQCALPGVCHGGRNTTPLDHLANSFKSCRKLERVLPSLLILSCWLLTICQMSVLCYPDPYKPFGTLWLIGAGCWVSNVHLLYPTVIGWAVKYLLASVQIIPLLVFLSFLSSSAS